MTNTPNNTHPTQYPKNVTDHIAAVAHDIVVKYGLPFADEADIRQEIAKRLTTAKKNYRPEKSSFYTFAQGVVRKARKTIEHRLNEPRSLRAEASLDETVSRGNDEERETTSLVETVADPAADPDRMRAAIDLRDAVASLAPRDREFCRLYMAGETLTDALKKAGLPISAFYERIAPAVKRYLGQ